MNLQKALSIFDKLKELSPNFILAGSAAWGKEEDLHELEIIYLGKEIPEVSRW